MEEAGFVDVHESADVWPINKWPKNAKYKELGELSTSRFSSRLEEKLMGRVEC